MLHPPTVEKEIKASVIVHVLKSTGFLPMFNVKAESNTQQPANTRGHMLRMYKNAQAYGVPKKTSRCSYLTIYIFQVNVMLVRRHLE